MYLKAGYRVKIRFYEKRPDFWNREGRMDRFMGKIVTIREASNSNRIFRISEDQEGYTWRFENIEKIIIDPNFLFVEKKGSSS